MRRTDEDQEIINKGKLWKQFKETVWYEDLSKFIEEQEKIGREACSDLTINGQYELAKAAALKVAGILVVKSYMEDSISNMEEIYSAEKEDKEYKESIPSHV